VTLFASGDSRTSAKLVSVVPKPLRELPEQKDIYGFNTNSMLNLGLAYSRQDQFDIIHDHNALMGLPTANVAKTPVVMTWHGPYDADIRRYFSMLNHPKLVSISQSQARLAPGLNFIGAVHNGLSMGHYPFNAYPKNYLIFVGRIDPEKGVHLAIDAAVRLKKELIIAAKLDDGVPSIQQYYLEEILPRLEKHADLVHWVGEVDEEERNRLLKDAQCLLHAVTWPEPFGLTMIEAMACGTPVVAFNQGSIPEIVVDGKTGFVVEDVDQMVEAVGKLHRIDRGECRQHALTNFSAQRMADGYEEMYRLAMKLSENELHTKVMTRIPIDRYARHTTGIT
jgi:glycosyltransferase involved in cell wall biosynthesis